MSDSIEKVIDAMEHDASDIRRGRDWMAACEHYATRLRALTANADRSKDNEVVGASGGGDADITRLKRYDFDNDGVYEEYSLGEWVRYDDVESLLATPASPAGGDWVMVPREPTAAMLRNAYHLPVPHAGAEKWLREDALKIWNAMLAASPQQEPGAVPSDDELTGMWERADLIGGATDCVTPADESGAVGRAFTEEVGRDDKPTGYFLFESAPSGQTPTGADRDGLPECIWIPAVVLIAYSSEPDPRDAPRVKYRLANLSTATSAGTTGDSEDAARYRWLRGPSVALEYLFEELPNEDGFRLLPGEELDAAIDDARRAREVGNG